MKLYQILLIVLAAMSALSFCVYGMDKRRAARGQWRISEKALLLLSFFLRCLSFGIRRENGIFTW